MKGQAIVSPRGGPTRPWPADRADSTPSPGGGGGRALRTLREEPEPGEKVQSDRERERKAPRLTRVFPMGKCGASFPRSCLGTICQLGTLLPNDVVQGGVCCAGLGWVLMVCCDMYGVCNAHRGSVRGRDGGRDVMCLSGRSISRSPASTENVSATMWLPQPARKGEPKSNTHTHSPPRRPKESNLALDSAILPNRASMDLRWPR